MKIKLLKSILPLIALTSSSLSFAQTPLIECTTSLNEKFILNSDHSYTTTIFKSTDDCSDPQFKEPDISSYGFQRFKIVITGTFTCPNEFWPDQNYSIVVYRPMSSSDPTGKPFQGQFWWSRADREGHTYNFPYRNITCVSKNL